MTKRKTDAEFKQEVFDLVGNEYTFLDPYVNAQTKIRVRHNKCGKIYEVKPNKFLNGRRCSYCSIKSMRKAGEQFRDEVFNLVGNEYTFLNNYVNTRTKIKVRHNKCGKTYKVTPHRFLNGNRCPYCYGKFKKTDEQFKQEVYDLVGDEYTFLDSYVNNHTKLKVKHNKCCRIYKVTPTYFLEGKRCPWCSIKANKKTSEHFKQEVFDLVGDEYVFLDDYINARTKLRVKHNKCGNVYNVKPSNFINGSRCPYCHSPKGEILISKILDILNISYESQKSFNDLKDKDCLTYDFYIPDQNILIEYQGIQHYQAVDYFGGEDQFKVQQKHDKMKSDYAKNNNYNLITIPYTKNNFSKIKKYLLQHGLSK